MLVQPGWSVAAGRPGGSARILLTREVVNDVESRDVPVFLKDGTHSAARVLADIAGWLCVCRRFKFLLALGSPTQPDTVCSQCARRYRFVLEDDHVQEV